MHIGLNGVITTVTGFGPGAWGWRSQTVNSQPFTVAVTNTELYTVSLWLREDGLRLDRLLLTTDTNYVPTGFGPAETERLTGSELLAQALLTRTIVYTYDDLYRLTQANYTTGQNYQYDYDEVGNRLEQIINGDTTTYLYDDANRLESVTHLSATQPYTFDHNGNLLYSGVMTNTFDAANRLVSSSREGVTVQPVYNGVGDRVRQTVGATTTYYTLDVEGLPEVITSDGEIYLHLPGVIVTEKADQVRYLLGDGLGSIRQAVDGTGAVVAYNAYDPYGNPVQAGSQPYGFSGEWWQEELGLLHLRARWLMPETGTFLSRDPVESEPPYQYVRGNLINRTDPSDFIPACKPPNCQLQIYTTLVFPIQGTVQPGHLGLIFTDEAGRWFSLSSGPERSEYFNWGILKGGEPAPYVPEASKQGEDEAIVTIAAGMEICPKIKCLARTMNIITSMEIPYDPLSRSSNAAVYTALKACNLPTNDLLKRLTSELPANWSGIHPFRIHPGWGLDLLAPPTPNWMDPPMCHDYPELCYKPYPPIKI